MKGLNRLYFLYEAYDNYWDFARPGLHNDIFEVVVDGDMSGGPLIESFQPTKELSERDAHFSMHGVQAQNYHIMTPPLGKDWALAWGCNSYVKNLPYANAAYNYNFKPGESGQADAGVLDHAVRLRRLRGSAARGGIGADGEQADRPGVGDARLRRRQQRDARLLESLAAAHDVRQGGANWWRSG